MQLSVGLLLALREADLSSDDVAARLRDAISDKFRGSGTWAYFVTYFGDAESGEVVYSSEGDTRKAAYEISGTGDKAAKCVIEFDASTNVVPRTVYEEESEDADEYATMAESAKTYSALPVYERFISKTERDSMGADDFAGKNRSFPIKKAEDVQAAFHALGRAGSDNYSVATIRSNIIRIAKAKGFKLPKSAQAKESASITPSGVKLRESVAFEIDLQLREALNPTREIKLIAPGKGASAFYPAEVLKRDGPKVFRAGTPMRIDHPTRAEETARPEGSVRDWGAVLEADAVWRDEHKQGPGLYGRIKPFSDHAQLIEEKGPYAGVSIRANGNAVMESGKPVLRDGVPVLAELVSAEGVDMVTRAGAGGMFLQESARDEVEETGDVSMTEAEKAEFKKLIEASTAPFRERALRGDAVVVAGRVLSGVSFSDAQKQFVIEECLRGTLPTDGDNLDEKKFSDLVVAEAKRFGAVLGNGGKVRGLGAVAVEEAGMKNCPHCDGDGEDEDGEDCEHCDGKGKVPMKAKKAKESAAVAETGELATRLQESLGMSEAAAKRAAGGR